MSESRTELLAWLNDLLQINYTKVEQVGTGAAHCQIIDSIYRDVPMSKVKFDAKHEYEYVQNFKVLQNSFAQRKLDKVIPVERLIQCKFQDNLEFLQWMKKYWDSYYPGGKYDAPSRRKGKVAGGPVARKPAASPVAQPTMKKTLSNPSVDRAAKGVRSNTSSRIAAGQGNNSVDQSVVDELSRKVTELNVSVDGLERERDFYFGKLRDIEILTQQHVDGASEGMVGDAGSILKEIQTILYSTEDGFEVPQDGNVVAQGAEDGTF